MVLAIQKEQPANPELEQFKETVVKTAKKYTAKNGWCDEVNKALKEMGIDESESLTPATVTVNLVVEVSTNLKNEDFAGLSPVEELAKAQEAIADKLKVVNTTGSVNVTRLSVASVDPLDTSGDPYVQYVKRYISNEGRVMHLFPMDTPFDSHGARVSDYALCGDGSLWYSILYDAVENSARGTGRVCAKCAKRA